MEAHVSTPNKYPASVHHTETPPVIKDLTYSGPTTIAAAHGTGPQAELADVVDRGELPGNATPEDIEKFKQSTFNKFKELKAKYDKDCKDKKGLSALQSDCLSLKMSMELLKYKLHQKKSSIIK